MEKQITNEQIIKEENISKDKTKDINSALLDFVLRVSRNPDSRDAEIQALPEVAKVVLETLKPRPIIRHDLGYKYVYFEPRDNDCEPTDNPQS